MPGSFLWRQTIPNPRWKGIKRWKKIQDFAKSTKHNHSQHNVALFLEVLQIFIFTGNSSTSCWWMQFDLYRCSHTTLFQSSDLFLGSVLITILGRQIDDDIRPRTSIRLLTPLNGSSLGIPIIQKLYYAYDAKFTGLNAPHVEFCAKRNIGAVPWILQSSHESIFWGNDCCCQVFNLP